MSDYQPIIDVQPLDHSREQAGGGSAGSSGRRSSQSPSGSAASSRRSSTGAVPPFGAPYAQCPAAAAASKVGGSAIGGIARIVAGAGMVMIGVPMLILPGPGLLSIVAGGMLMASGARRLFG